MNINMNMIIIIVIIIIKNNNNNNNNNNSYSAGQKDFTALTTSVTSTRLKHRINRLTHRIFPL